MNWILRNVGGIFLVAGIASAIYSFMDDYESRYFSWIDDFGTAQAWGIRVAAVVIGAGLIFASSRMQKTPASSI